MLTLDIPVTEITSIRDRPNRVTDGEETYWGEEKLQRWYESKIQIGNGLSDFTHISTADAGHQVMNWQPELVTEHLEILIEKVRN